MPLNLIRNPYSKLTAILLLICAAYAASAQETSPCEISGPTTVAYGNSATYYLSGNCATGTTLTTTCGQISGPVSGNYTINFNNSSCTTATISTPNGAAQSLTVIVTSALGGGNVINQFQSPINYNTAPQAINATPATGGSCGGAYQYQWFSSPDEATWTIISGATGQNYQPGPLTALTYFKREVICSLTGSLDNNTAYTDNWALVDVCSQVTTGTISPTIQYINKSVIPSSQLSTSGVGGGCSVTYSYQWQSSPDNSTWTNITGATGSTYAPPALNSTTYYRLAVTNNGAVAYSASSEVYVYQATNIIITPSASYVNINTSPGALTLSGYTGNLSNYTFQWQSSTSSSFASPTNVGTNSTTYTPGNLTATTYYRVQVTNSGVIGYSDTATVTVYPGINPGTISPHIVFINYNTIPPPFTISHYGGGNGSYTFQWEESTVANFSTFTNVGGDSSTYTPTTPDTVRTYFRCKIISNGASITNTLSGQVFPDPTLVAGTLSPASQTVTSGTPAAITVLGTSGGAGAYVYQWQTTWDTTKPGTYMTISSQSDTSTSFIPPPNPGIEYYRVIITANSTVSGVPGYISYASAVTNWAVVAVNLPLSGGTISGPSGVIPYNTSPGALGSTQDGIGGSCFPGDFRYQWQFSVDGVNFYNVWGAIANTYTPFALTASMYFRRAVSCSGNTAYSNTIYVQVAAGTQQNCTVSN